jgi:hypothetical protein
MLVAVAGKGARRQVVAGEGSRIGRAAVAAVRVFISATR